MDHNIFPVRISTHFRKIQRPKSEQAWLYATVSICMYSGAPVQLRISEIPGPTYSTLWCQLSFYDESYKICITCTVYRSASGYGTGGAFQNEVPLSAKDRRSNAVENVNIDHSQSGRYRDWVKAWKIRGSVTQPVC